jgi:hypothetical protein
MSVDVLSEIEIARPRKAVAAYAGDVRVPSGGVLDVAFVARSSDVLSLTPTRSASSSPTSDWS